MSPIEFANYQRQLNAQRENLLKTTPKLSPKVILSDDLFDASINDIPFNIKPPVLPVVKPQIKEYKDPKVNPLFDL